MKLMNRSAVSKRLKSPISATKTSAVSVSTPRRQRKRLTVSRHGSCSAVSWIETLERLDPTINKIDRVHIAIERLLLSVELEPLLGEPPPTLHTPRFPRQHSLMTQTELRQTIPVTHPVQPRVLTSPHKITNSLQLTRRNTHRLEQPTSMQPRKPQCVTTIGLHAIAGPLGNKTGCHDLARDPLLTQIPVQPKPARPGLVTTPRPRPATNRPRHRHLLIRQRALLQQHITPNSRQTHRPRMHIQPHNYRPTSSMVGDLRMWLYRATPGNPRHSAGADHHHPATGHPALPGGNSILSSLGPL